MIATYENALKELQKKESILTAKLNDKQLTQQEELEREILDIRKQMYEVKANLAGFLGRKPDHVLKETGHSSKRDERED